jgi:hypothetical protein
MKLAVKWFIRVAFILCAIMVCTLVGLSFLIRTTWFAEGVRDGLSRQIGRAVAFTDMKPLIRTGVGAQVDNFVIYEMDGVTPFVDAERVRVRVRLIPLLFRRVRLSELTVVKPQIRLVEGKEGRWNFETLLKRPDASRPGPQERQGVHGSGETEKQAGLFSIARSVVRDGTVTVSSDRLPSPVRLLNISLDVRDIAAGKLPYLKGGGDLAPFTIDAASVKEVRRLGVDKCTISGGFRCNGWLGDGCAFQSRWELTGGAAAVNGSDENDRHDVAFSFSLTGKGILGNDKKVTVQEIRLKNLRGDGEAAGELRYDPVARRLDAVFSGRRFSWEPVSRMAAENGIVLSGTSDWDAQLELRDEKLKAVVRGDLSGSGIHHGRFVKKKSGIPLTMEVPLTLSDAYLRWNRAVLGLGEMELHSEGMVERDGERDWSVSVVGKDLPLLSLHDLIVTDGALNGRGEIDIRLSRDKGSGQRESPAVTGTVRIEEGSYAFPGLRNPLYGDMLLSCSGHAFELKLTTLRMGSSVAEGRVTLDIGARSEVAADIHIVRFDPADFASRRKEDEKQVVSTGRFPAIFGSEAVAAPSLPAERPGALPAFLTRMTGEGNIRISELVWGGLRSENGTAHMGFRDGVFTADRLTLPLYGGVCEARARVESSGDARRCSAQATARDVDAGALIRAFTGRPPILTGTLNSSVQAELQGAGWRELAQGVRSSGTFSIHDAALTSSGMLRQFAPVLIALGNRAKIKEFTAMGERFKAMPQTIELSRCDGSFRLKGREAGDMTLVMETAGERNSLRLELDGVVRSGGAIRMEGHLAFPRGSSHYQSLEPYFPDDGGWIALPLPVPIRGTVSEPRVDKEAAAQAAVACAAEIGKLRLRKELEKKIDKMLSPPDGEKNGTPAGDMGREMLKGASKELLKKVVQ